MDDLITIIVPIYKIKEEFLRQCIESILNQGRKDYRVILVDDGSPDNCGKICDEYAETDGMVSVIHQKNQGVSAARNNGMKAAETKWITFVDADDWIENDYITTLYESLKNKAYNADVVMFDYKREYKNKKSCESFGRISGKLTDEEKDTCKEATYYKHIRNGKLNPYTIIAIWNKVYNSDFLRNNSLLFSNLISKGEDRVFNFAAFQYANEVYYLNESIYHYRCWEESTVNRYNPCIIEQTESELNGLMEQIVSMDCDESIYEKFRCRICTRMYSCMRLYIFHKKNKCSLHQKLSQARQLAQRDLFREATEKVNLKLLSSQEKIFILCVKFKCFFLAYLLVKVKDSMKKQQLN